MNKSNMFIRNDEFLRVLIRSFHLNISCEEEETLVNKLHTHIEHTRQVSFKNGYDQGRFDEKIDSYSPMSDIAKETFGLDE